MKRELGQRLVTFSWLFCWFISDNCSKLFAIKIGKILDPADRMYGISKRRDAFAVFQHFQAQVAVGLSIGSIEALKYLRHLRSFEDFTASNDEFASRTTVEPYLVTDK